MIPRIQGIFDSWGFSKALLPQGPVYQVFSVQSGVIGLKLLAYLQLPSSPSRVGEGGMGAPHFFLCLQVVVVLQQVFQLIQKVLSKWLNDAQVVEVSADPCHQPPW